MAAIAIFHVLASPKAAPSRSLGRLTPCDARSQSFAIGFFICHSLGYGALSSGVSTTFVALAGRFDLLRASTSASLPASLIVDPLLLAAEDPEVLAERDPELFELIRRAYPQVVTSV